jgi:hypothetical protein
MVARVVVIFLEDARAGLPGNELGIQETLPPGPPAEPKDLSEANARVFLCLLSIIFKSAHVQALEAIPTSQSWLSWHSRPNINECKFMQRLLAVAKEKLSQLMLVKA